MTDPRLPLRLPEGTALGRFVVAGWVRDGGMAGLYRGRAPDTGERVAIKVQLPASASDPSQRARFDREVDVMRRLEAEPHVVRIFDDGTLGDGRRYLVSEWIEGENLEELLDRLRDDDRNLGLVRVVALARELAVGLGAIHRHRVVHRDLKPANIMVTPTGGGGERVKIVDFGVSADLGGDGQDQELTTAGMVIGTDGYMAPEQAAGVAAHPAFDVYAFGAVLFEVVTGARLPPSGWATDVIATLTKLRPRVPPALAELVAACLEQNPARRPESAEVLVDRLESIGSSSGSMATASVGAVEAAAEAHARPAGRAEGRLAEESAVRSRGRPEPRGDGGLDRRWLWVLVIPLFGIGAWWLLRTPVWGESDGPDDAVVTHPATPRAAGADDGLGGSGDTGRSTSGGTGVGSTAEAGTGTGGDAGAGASTDRRLGTTEAEVASSDGAEGHAPERSVADLGPSQTMGETSTSSTPLGYDDRRRCARIRSLATTAAAKARWKEVLLHSQDDVECWTKRTDRVELRVRALFNLGEHIKCIREGAGSKSQRVKKFVEACRARLHEAG